MCSGIEAASFVLRPLHIRPLWLSENAPFPSGFLKMRYPEIPNLGDMNDVPQLLKDEVIEAPDLLCGGTPCQAFSLAGWKNGLEDHRGLLTMKYIDILNEMDCIRIRKGKGRALFFWENVEGVLTDKTNAFGCFLSGLAGMDEPLEVHRWSSSGVLHGKIRNIAWRVMDAKYFGLPQQRRRIYVLGGGTDFYPENILFDTGEVVDDPYKDSGNLWFGQEMSTSIPRELTRAIEGNDIEIFRTYTDCLYAAYGTKWNGNAAAFNGSLFVSQNGRLRRLTPIECERLMGFPDDYTNIEGASVTNRYRVTGNSWAVNVIRWIMRRLKNSDASVPVHQFGPGLTLFKDFVYIGDKGYLNATAYPYDFRLANLLDFIDVFPDEKLYISKAGCSGILRRKFERKARMNGRLEAVLRINSQL
ncbi:MAG: DNA cytosine methyltransferase [Bacteroidales bacterium]|nr:DNA cytosine methyltransferase [Bacteroidales bacterium]